MTRTVQFINTTQSIADSLLGDFRWVAESGGDAGAVEGSSLILTYSFVSSANDLYQDARFGYDASDADYDYPFRSAFRAFDQFERSLAQSIFNDYENIIDIEFVEIDDPSQANLRLSITDLSLEEFLGGAFSPSSKFVPFTVDSEEIHEASELSGDVWIDDDLDETIFRETLIHEIGHALGLSHPHENGFEFIEDVTNGTLSGDLDYNRYTVMSYEVKPASIDESSVDFWSVASTPMPLDIDALISLYGSADNESNDVYIINQFVDSHVNTPTLGYGGFEQHDYTNSYISIVDNGGINALVIPVDLNLRIDLRADSWSNTQGGFLAGDIDDDNLYIASGTVIHELITGAGDDVVTGNHLNNTISTSSGDDTYYYVDGSDSVDGGDGSDIIEFASANFSAYKFVSGEGGTLTLSEVAGGDVISLSSVETLVFGEHTLRADSLAADISAASEGLVLDEGVPLYLSDIGTETQVIESTDAQLYRIYFGSLGRIPDQGGFEFWKEQVESEVFSFAEVSARFIDSSEFQGLADVNGLGGVDDFEFLDHMYANVLGRVPDQDGYVWWLGQLDSDAHTQATAFANMVQSDEFVLTTAATVADFLFV